MTEHVKGHDMSRHWRLVTNEGGLITGTWWVTRPDERTGTSHARPVDVTMWNEGHHAGLKLHLNDFTAFVTDGAVDPILVRARHDYVTREATARLDEIETAVLDAVAAADWPADERGAE